MFVTKNVIQNVMKKREILECRKNMRRTNVCHKKCDEKCHENVEYWSAGKNVTKRFQCTHTLFIAICYTHYMYILCTYTVNCHRLHTLCVYFMYTYC